MKLVPDQKIIVNDYGEGANHISVACADDGSFAFVYTPTGKTLIVDMSKIAGKKVQAYWYSPRNGLSTKIALLSGSGTQEFKPPTNGRGNDWVLVLDDAEHKFPMPGAKTRKTRFNR
jgi:hypothetical protein